MSSSREWPILALLAVLLAVGGWFAGAPGEREASDVSSSYSADPKGVKAFYTLVGERLGYTAQRLRHSYADIPPDAKVLVVVQPLEERPILPDELRQLEDWVRRGGTVVFAADRLRGVPEGFRRDRAVGMGHVYAFDTRRVVTNEGVRDHRNALRALEIIARHAQPPDMVLFDEYHHGLAEGERSVLALMGRQVKAALVILAAAGLALVHSRAKRFGAVRPLPEASAQRPGVEFVESVARLYQRAHAPDVAAGILCSSFRRDLCAKLGLSPDAARVRTEQAAGPMLTDTARASLARVLDGCEAGHGIGEPELAGIARDIHSLEQELGIARVRG